MMKFFEYIYGFETIIYEYVNRKELIFSKPNINGLFNYNFEEQRKYYF